MTCETSKVGDSSSCVRFLAVVLIQMQCWMSRILLQIEIVEECFKVEQMIMNIQL